MGSTAVRKSGVAHSPNQEYEHRGNLKPAKNKAHEDKASLSEGTTARQANQPHTDHPDPHDCNYTLRGEVPRQQHQEAKSTRGGSKNAFKQCESNPRNMR